MKLETIQFTGASNSLSGHAIRARKNATETIPIPEWSADRFNAYDNSAAVYVIAANRDRKISIKVQFSTQLTSLKNKKVEVQAIQPPISGVLQTHVNVLGSVKARVMKFDQAGQTGVESFELSNHRLATRGVGISQVIWHWQFRLPGTLVWQNLETTVHKVYTILEAPNGPWTQNMADNIHLPWTDVLDYACTWANRAQTLKQAGSMVTEAVFNLGPNLLEYNCVNFLPAYVISLNGLGDSYFDCSAFLWHLKTGLVNRFVICTDCACIVTTFANALGCDLWQSKMYTQGVSFFKINPILAIGNRQWNLPCGIAGFSYHEVGWANGCDVNDEVYDACLAIDKDVNPSFAPHFPFIARDLKFGQVGEGLYRDRLAFPTDVHFCTPQPSDRQRRRLSPPQFSLASPMRQKAMTFDDDRCKLLKEQLQFDEWSDQNQLEENLFIFNHTIPDNSLKSWRPLYSRNTTNVSNRALVIDDLWRPAYPANYSAIKITKYESASRREAHELLIRLMANAHVAINYEKMPDLGDVAFAGPRKQTVLFARGNVLMVLSNADRRNLDLIQHAKKIDASFCQRESGEPMELALNKAKAKPQTTALKLTKMKGGKMRIEFPQQRNLKAKAKEIATPGLGEMTNLKFFSSDGEILLEKEELVLIPKSKVKPKVSVSCQLGDRLETFVL